MFSALEFRAITNGAPWFRAEPRSSVEWCSAPGDGCGLAPLTAVLSSSAVRASNTAGQ